MSITCPKCHTKILVRSSYALKTLGKKYYSHPLNSIVSSKSCTYFTWADDAIVPPAPLPPPPTAKMETMKKLKIFLSSMKSSYVEFPLSVSVLKIAQDELQSYNINRKNYISDGSIYSQDFTGRSEHERSDNQTGCIDALEAD